MSRPTYCRCCGRETADTALCTQCDTVDNRRARAIAAFDRLSRAQRSARAVCR